MAAGYCSGDMFVGPGLVCEEVVVDGKAGCQRAIGRDPRLHVGCVRDGVPAGDLRGATLPIRTLTAGLLVIGVRKAGFVGDAVVFVAVHGGRHVPSATATGATGRADAEEQRRFGEIDCHTWVAALNAKFRLDGCRTSEGHAGATAPLVLDRRNVILSVGVSPVVG